MKIPSTAPVGIWKLIIETSSGNSGPLRHTCKEQLYVLFNPWVQGKSFISISLVLKNVLLSIKFFCPFFCCRGYGIPWWRRITSRICFEWYRKSIHGIVSATSGKAVDLRAVWWFCAAGSDAVVRDSSFKSCWKRESYSGCQGYFCSGMFYKSWAKEDFCLRMNA